jgi:RNA polymerase sigma-B factor
VALRCQLDALAREVDACRAWRTVPRGSHAGDPRRAPAVDLDVWVVHVRYHRSRSHADLTLLVDEYLPYALSIAHRLQRQGESRDDLEQVALESLVTALQRFDPGRGTPFAAFASPTITGAIKRHFRDRGWGVRTSRRVHDLAGPVRASRDRLAGDLGREPTTAEVAADLEVEVDVVDEVEQAMQARSTSSLDRPVGEGGLTVLDTLGEDDHDLDLTDSRIALSGALELLSDRDRELLALYYVEELPQREIARRYGVSQMQVSRWLSRIVGRLRARMAA